MDGIKYSKKIYEYANTVVVDNKMIKNRLEISEDEVESEVLKGNNVVIQVGDKIRIFVNTKKSECIFYDIRSEVKKHFKLIDIYNVNDR